MLLIPVVVVVGGILALVLYLEKQISTLSRVGPQSKAPRSLPTTQGQRARPPEGVVFGRARIKPRLRAGQKLAIQRTKGPARRKSPRVGRLRGA